jgi:hypothetical protein
MKRSSQRILTTHIGNLSRPKALWELIDAKDKDRTYDQGALDIQLKAPVTASVRKQVEAEIDIPSDGKQSKASFTNYMRERLSGLEGVKYRALSGCSRTILRLRGSPASQGPESSSTALAAFAVSTWVARASTVTVVPVWPIGIEKSTIGSGSSLSPCHRKALFDGDFISPLNCNQMLLEGI